MRKVLSSCILAILLCGGTIHVTSRQPEPVDSQSDNGSNDSSGDGCTDGNESGDGGEF